MEEYTVDALILDQSKLTSDQSDIFLLQYLSKAEAALIHLTVDDIKPVQPAFEASLLKILTSPPTSSPKPGRPIRHLVARCLVVLHKKAENRSLFEFVREILKVAGGEVPRGAKEAERETKVACWYVVGEVMKELGANNMSFMSDICLAALKLLKANAQPVILRYHALLAMQKSFITAGKAVSDQLGKDILKQLRNGLSDKALSIQRVCAEALQTLAQRTTFVTTLSDIESILTPAFKSFETADHQTRRSLSHLIAHLLAATQVEGSAPIVEAPKKKKSTNPDDDDDQGSTPSGAAQDASKTLLTTNEMLHQLSTPFNRQGTSRKTRNAIVDVYSTLFSTLGATYVEAHYPEILGHLLTDIVSFIRNTQSKHEILVVRKSVGILLRDLIGVRLLSEQGQIGAIRELVSSYLKKWSPSPMPGIVAPTQLVLVPVLNEIAGLLEQLGNAPPPVQEVLSDPLLRLVTHPSQSVRVAAAWCLRCFCHTTPLRLSKTITSILSDLNKDVGMLGTPVAPTDIGSRMMGRAFALSSLIAVIPERPLYVSYDLSANVLDLSISLLKRAGEHDVKIATIEVQVAWTLIGSLMTLGPSFVKLHLPQLLVLWRNALPKPTSKDSSTGARGEAEWKFLLDVREATLTSILSFLRHNLTQLVNLDVARRLVALLGNTLTFINTFTSLHAEALREQQLSSASSSGHIGSRTPQLSLSERETMLRKRIFQCFTVLGPSPATESLQPSLLAATVAVFADPDNFAGGSATQAAIAASAGHFAGVWASVDGYASGVTSLVTGDEYPVELDGGGGSGTGSNALNRDGVEVEIQSLLTSPIPGSVDNDPLSLCTSSPLSSSSTLSTVSIEQSLPSPPPAATGVVDAAIELFAILLPAQDVDTQAKILSQVVAHVRSSKLERHPARKMAVFVNSVEAVRRSLREVMATGGRKGKDTMGSGRVAGSMKEILQDAVLDSDLTLRTAGSEALGRLASISGTTFLNTSIQWLVDQIVNNRNPESRAGCALSFGAIYTFVGSLIGGPLLKTMVNILVSLANDPHPVVHFWSMTSLAQVITAASLSYSPFISSTLGQLASIYLTDTHEPEGGSIGSVNIRGDLPAYQIVCRIISAIVGVLGPELQEAGAVRSLVFILVNEFSLEEDEGISVEAIKCHQQFLMFAPSQVDVPKLVASFRTHLASARRPLKVASVNALYQLVQRDAPLMSKLGGNQLVEDLFGLLDDDPSIEGVRDVISNWAKQTSAASPSGWIDLCQRIMNRTTASQQVTSSTSTTAAQASRFQDDEVESIVASTEAAKAAGIRLTSRWRTQLFALQCLHDIVVAVVSAGRPEQLNSLLARETNLNPRAMLVSRVGDLIRMAFSASTAQVTEIRLQGLTVLRDVIQTFALSPDPDFEGSLLLEQHQAPIAAALTPAFASDSTPEVLASAVQICAVFVGSGVIKQVDRMGRILKLLTNALEQCQDADMASLGEVRDLSTNASIMLKISILTAWAELQSSSLRQEYLRDVIKPHRAALAPFWVTSLQDYARIRTDPEAGPGSSSMGSSADLAASGLGREVLLPYYERSWAPILQAVASTMEEQDLYVLSAMDGVELPVGTSPPPAPAQRSDPTTYFFVVYGLAFEALATSAGESSSYHSETGVSVPMVALTAMKSLVEQRFSGNVLLEGPIFDELCTLFYRLAMTAPPVAQAKMVLVLASLAKSHAVALAKGAIASDDPGSSSEPSQLHRCLAVVAYVLRQAIPAAGEPARFTSDSATDRVNLIKTALVAYMEIVDVFPVGQREDLYAVSIYLYSELLKDESSRVDLAGPTLMLLKMLCDRAYASRQQSGQVFPRVINGLLSACIGHIEEMRGRSGAVAATKVKNNLLALTLLLTALPAEVKIGRAVVERTCDIIGQKLSEEDEIAITAVQCAKTLILTSSRGNPTMQHCVGQIVPSLIAFIGRVVEIADELDKSDGRMAGVEDVVKAFVGFAAGINGEESKTRTYTILLPTLILLLDPTAIPSTPTHSLVVANLLSLASQAPSSFRDATATLSPEAKSILETSIRQSVESSRKVASAGVEKKVAPQIALRSFG